MGRSSVRPASAADRELLFRWANDAEVRRNSFHPDTIRWDEHVSWFDRTLVGDHRVIWVLEIDGVPAGQARYELVAPGIAEVGISIASEFRGRGHAAELLRRTAPLACSRSGLTTIEAYVIVGNDASRRAFIRAGYRETGTEERYGRRAWRFELACDRPPAVRVRAAIFDLWGTLVPYPTEAVERTAAAMAEVLRVPVDDFARAWGADFDRRVTGALADSLRRVSRTLGIEPRDETIAEAVARRTAMHEAHFLPRADAADALAGLRALGVAVGLLTDCSNELPPVWNASSLRALVDAAVFSCEEGTKKPDPRLYRLVAERLGVRPGECVYVGDGGSDELNGATAAGMCAVQLRTGDTTQPAWDGPRISALGEIVGIVRAQ